MLPWSCGEQAESLHKLCLEVMACHFRHFRSVISEVPLSLRFDFYMELLDQDKLDLLNEELRVRSTFLSLLREGGRRSQLHRLLQSVIDSGESLQKSLSSAPEEMSQSEAFNLASFFQEAGWFSEAKDVLTPFYRNREAAAPCPLITLALLQSTSSNCEFAEVKALRPVLDCLSHPTPAAVHSQLSTSAFERSEYSEAFKWSMKALQSLGSSSPPPKVLIDVLRMASKVYVVRRQFLKAELLITEAIYNAKKIYGDQHPKYADCILDYGYYLLNADKVDMSLKVYRIALEIRKKCFGRKNLQVAIALEGLAYATYVSQYNTGQFRLAKSYAEESLSIMESILPENHLLLASSKRVLALIIEEIAVDHEDEKVSWRLLLQAEELHRSAISLSIQSFGELNVQTAKHYGNLGRLNQSMKRYGTAEEMHVKAIQIKEELLGNEDHEVALSVGHLASLYNYDVRDYTRAEHLYRRSIQIGVKLFGPGYSGLEYDYRGLIRIYQDNEDWQNFLEYTYKLREWEDLQSLRNQEERTIKVPVLSKFEAGKGLPIPSILDALHEDMKTSSNED